MYATNLGRCPDCDEPIPDANKIIQYETSEGWTAMFAECPGCREVVHPQ